MYQLLVKLFPSSVNPAQLSLTVRGLGVAVIPLLVWYFQIDEMTANKVFNVIVGIVDKLSAIVAGFMIIIGLVRKIQ